MLSAAWSPPRGRRTRARARAEGSAGRRCAARGGGEGPGRPAAAGRGLGGAARLPRARPLSPRAPARSPSPAAVGAPRQEGRRALATPTARRAPGRAAFKDANSASRLWTPEDRGSQGRLRPAAPPGSGFFPKPQAVSGADGRAPGGGGVRGRDCAASSVNRFFTGVVRKGPES